MFAGVGDAFAINGGGLGLTANSSISNLTLNGGTLSGTGSVVVTDAFNWTGGAISGPGLFVTANTSTTTLSGGTKTLVGRTWEQQGAVTWMGGDIVLGNAAVLNNRPGGTILVNAANGPSNNILGTGTLKNFAGATFNVAPEAIEITIRG